MRRERTSNFEILRIISMCGIIAIHYLAGHLGGMVVNPVFPSFDWFLSQVVYSIACPLVNCFVLISGYFLINRNTFSLRRSIELIIITMFYGMVGYCIGLLTGTASVSIKNIIFAAIPFFAGKRWFVETYIILILLAPFINKILLAIDKKSFQILLVVQTLIFSGWYSLGLSAPLLDDGYGIINFVTLYLVGAYCKLYGEELFLWKIKRCYLMLGYIICTLITFVLSYFIYPFGYAFITNVIGSVFVFIYFARLQVGCNQRINAISAAAFDVYFVHSDMYTSRLLIYELLQGKLFVGSVWMIVHMFAAIVILYFFGVISHKLRTYIFSKSVSKWLDQLPIINITHRI